MEFARIRKCLNFWFRETLACSRLSNNGGERKIGASEEKKRVGIEDGGAGAGEQRFDDIN